jgi:membrane protease YdiL (CAAX protease family)
MLVSFGSPLVNSFYLLNVGPKQTTQMSGVGSLVSIIHEGTGLLLLGYVLSRHGRRFRDLGLKWSLKDVGVGLVVTAASFLSYVVGATLLQLAHYSMYGSLAPSRSPVGFFANPSPLAAVPFVLLNPFFEELIVRSYLMTEITELTGSMTLAVALSVFVQAAYHLYYGWWGAISMGFQFLILAVYYARSRRALPIIVAHGLFDLYGFIRLL